MTTTTKLNRGLAGLVAATAALFALLAPTAKAGVLVASSPGCEAQDLARVFLPWGDIAKYQFAPDGGFESGADGWDLSGEASVVDGNSAHHVHGAHDKRSLLLPTGSSAMSPTICVGLEHPTLRFFAKKVSGSNLLSAMTVSVRTESALGAMVEVPVGVVTPSFGWQPTLPMTVVANLLPLLPGDYAPVQLRFTALAGSWQMDDLYVDPTRRN